MAYIWYQHDDRQNPDLPFVCVRDDLKGRHKEFCLCYGCKKFHPGRLDNCEIANDTFVNCIKHNIVTPVWECPEVEH